MLCELSNNAFSGIDIESHYGFTSMLTVEKATNQIINKIDLHVGLVSGYMSCRAGMAANDKKVITGNKAPDALVYETSDTNGKGILAPIERKLIFKVLEQIYNAVLQQKYNVNKMLDDRKMKSIRLAHQDVIQRMEGVDALATVLELSSQPFYHAVKQFTEYILKSGTRYGILDLFHMYFYVDVGIFTPPVNSWNDVIGNRTFNMWAAISCAYDGRYFVNSVLSLIQLGRSKSVERAIDMSKFAEPDTIPFSDIEHHQHCTPGERFIHWVATNFLHIICLRDHHQNLNLQHVNPQPLILQRLIQRVSQHQSYTVLPLVIHK